MLFRCSVILLAVGSMLVSGCGAPRSRDAAATASPPRPDVALNHFQSDGFEDPLPVLGTPKGGTSTSSSSADRIDAQAHYAAGVVHEMNSEADSALEEYYKAATLDSTNEALVLDVAQQFLQAKQPEKALDVLMRASSNAAVSSGLFADLGFVYSKLGKTNEAVNAGRIAIQKDPRSLAGYQSLFLEFLENKQTPEVVALLNDAAKMKGTDAEFLI